jgi:hypothetical protein
MGVVRISSICVRRRDRMDCYAIAEMKAFIQELQYPHLMMAGALLVVIGFIGYALRKNTEPNPKVGPKENSQRDAA